MNRLPSLLALLLSTAFLGGCPQGAGDNPFRQDAGEDAGADVATLDGALESGALCGADGKNECGPHSTCDEKLGCVECTRDVDCPIAAPLCLLGACVGCRPRLTDCPDGEACSTADFGCHTRCTGPSDCTDGTHCDESSGACVECTRDDQCAGRKCSPDKRVCVECNDDGDCPKAKPRCHVTTGACVRCTRNEDCGLAAPSCDPATFSCK